MKIPEDVGSKYRFIVLAGQRVAQLQKGARPRLEDPEKMKLTQIATHELGDGKLIFHKIEEENEETEAAATETAET